MAEGCRSLATRPKLDFERRSGVPGKRVCVCWGGRSGVPGKRVCVCWEWKIRLALAGPGELLKSVQENSSPPEVPGIRAGTSKERWLLGQELWYSAAGHRMRYLRLGPTAVAEARHPPLLLIHGLLGYSFSWRHNLEAFARERTVYAVDLAGIGYSERPGRGVLDLSLPATARRMLDFISALGLSQLDLLGTSHGGALALMMCALSESANPQIAQRLIRRLVLVAPTNPWSRAGRMRIAFLRTRLGGWIAGQSISRLRRARSIAIRRLYGDPVKVTQETVDGYSRMMDLPRTADYCLEIVKTWQQDMSRLKERLPSIAAPVLLIWGDLDRAVPPASGRHLATNLKLSELVIMRGVGHMPYEEAPREFNDLVLNYLDR